MVRLYDARANDPYGQLLDLSGIGQEDLEEISALMAALGALRDAEDSLQLASLEYMKLNKTDMRALHFLIVAENEGETVTPSALAAHLKISSASVTKMLDRLEKAGHVLRASHPEDRRALTITISRETKTAAMQTVGRQHSRRFYAAAKLSSKEREVVTKFINNMAQELLVGKDSWAKRE